MPVATRRELLEADSDASGGEAGERLAPILKVSGLSRAGAFSNVSLELRPGEILGLAGRYPARSLFAHTSRPHGPPLNLFGFSGSSARLFSTNICCLA